ncbi:polyprenyl synthetase family protein [Conexibacter arvalis]|uniref:Geranylgeranyl pyrophosphate synthase n=1 Tax=Conexibacter arvalis TaxID=912552 RepID=A0A840IAD1_9ACTN|nr:geranylgeranyl pyrophosphate synthase [Conexibacter arvalis]
MATAATLDAVVRAAGPQLGPMMERVEARLAALASGHGPVLARHGGATIAAGGKRLRPLLVFLAAGEEAATAADRLVRAAAAVELIHSASLVHDDVLDRAPLRRGQPTVVAVAGRTVATATGDLLFSRAFAEVAGGGEIADVRALSAASSALAAGELMQRADAWDVGVPLERYVERCELKTGSLFEAACRLGALAVGGPADELAAFGRRIGLAFQLLDDVLDVSGPASRTGKARGTDLLDGTVTLPLIVARERDPQLAAVDLQALDGEAAAEAICDRIAATGALVEAKRRALDVVAEAKALLPRLSPRQRATLELVADGVVERYA